jgi:flagellar motor switch protein FliM
VNDRLNPDQIAALFEAAKSGHVPESTPAPTRRNHRLRTVDFSRPTKFTSDHQRRILRAIDTFCATAQTRMTAELRCPIELEVINTTQVTWSSSQSQLPGNSLAVTLEVQPVGTRMLMTAEKSLVLTAIEAYLGGVPDKAPKERRFSEIDWTLSRRLVESIVNQLSLVFHELGGLSFAIEDIDLHSDASTIASVSEPTFVIMFEVRMNRQSSALALLIPWAAIDPVADRIAGRELVDESELAESGMGRALSAAPVTLRAEVAAIDLPVEEILSLAPGSVIRLGARADEGVSLFAENVKLGRAQPGCNGARRAVQISGSAEHE